MKRVVWFVGILATAACAFGQFGTNAIHPEYVFYVYLKDRTILKADNVGKADDPNFMRIVTKVGNELHRKDIPHDSVVQIKVEKRPQEKPVEEETLVRTLLDVSTDPIRYLDKTISVESATLTPSTYFNYGYRDARATHICFEIQDKTGRGHIYVAKKWEGAEQLRQRALKNGSVTGKFSVVMLADRYDAHSSAVLAELTGYSIPQSTP